MATQYRVLTEDQMALQRPVIAILNDPAGGEAKGDRYLVGDTGVNGFNGHDNEIARCTGTGPVTWAFDTPLEGWEVYDADTGLYYQYDGAAWAERPMGSFTAPTHYRIDSTPGSDHTGTGILSEWTAGETVAAGQVVYLKSDGKVWLADADAATTMPAIGIVETGGNADDTVTVLTHGFFRDDSWAWTVGGLVYVDTTTSGGLTQTAPSGTGDQVQVFGQATHADRILVMPSLVLVEVA